MTPGVWRISSAVVAVHQVFVRAVTLCSSVAVISGFADLQQELADPPLTAAADKFIAAHVRLAGIEDSAAVVAARTRLDAAGKRLDALTRARAAPLDPHMRDAFERWSPYMAHLSTDAPIYDDLANLIGIKGGQWYIASTHLGRDL